MIQNELPKWFVTTKNGMHKPVAKVSLGENTELFIDAPIQTTPTEAAEAASFFSELLHGLAPPTFHPYIGDDEHNETLIYYDGPQLLVRKSSDDRLFLCVPLPEETGAEDPWLSVEVTDVLMNAYKEGRVTIGEAFRMGGRKFVTSDMSRNVPHIPIATIPETHLPEMEIMKTEKPKAGINLFVQEARILDMDVITPEIVAAVCQKGYDTDRIHADLLEAISGEGVGIDVSDIKECSRIAWQGGTRGDHA